MWPFVGEHAYVAAPVSICVLLECAVQLLQIGAQRGLPGWRRSAAAPSTPPPCHAQGPARHAVLSLKQQHNKLMGGSKMLGGWAGPVACRRRRSADDACAAAAALLLLLCLLLLCLPRKILCLEKQLQPLFQHLYPLRSTKDTGGASADRPRAHAKFRKEVQQRGGDGIAPPAWGKPPSLPNTPVAACRPARCVPAVG